ncbi:MAG TPA: CHASE2 domain-containing protein, partial [Solirubrobacteraceae bacterium]
MSAKRAPGRPGRGALRAAGLFAAAVAVALQLTGALAAPEQETIGVRTRMQRPRPPRDVVVVAIDEASFQALRHSWPLPRSRHARAIDRLRAAGARDIVYDVQFTEPTRPAEDLALFRAIGRAHGAVLATTEIDHGRTAVLGGDDNLARVGAVAAASALPVGSGGVIDRVPFAVDGLPSIAVAAARRAGRTVRRGAFGGGGAWIRYAGPPGTVPTVRFSDLLAGHVDPALLRGRIAVVGATVPSLQDVHATP